MVAASSSNAYAKEMAIRKRIANIIWTSRWSSADYCCYSICSKNCHYPSLDVSVRAGLLMRLFRYFLSFFIQRICWVDPSSRGEYMRRVTVVHAGEKEASMNLGLCIGRRMGQKSYARLCFLFSRSFGRGWLTSQMRRKLEERALRLKPPKEGVSFLLQGHERLMRPGPPNRFGLAFIMLPPLPLAVGWLKTRIRLIQESQEGWPKDSIPMASFSIHDSHRFSLNQSIRRIQPDLLMCPDTVRIGFDSPDTLKVSADGLRNALYSPDSQRSRPVTKYDSSDDIGWQHGTMLGSRHNFKCNYCSFMGQGGGVSRLNKHLAGNRLAGYHNVHGCKMVPIEVKKFMTKHLNMFEWRL
ncbi:hypothetical protein Taro_001130 [Colocasia esculenta]|uniref:BED-type domain-containing protein n=1 Tax=Colocasia esculenta TaxID=4460 RepID=A0A843TA35_COLES|nr:hypothetical protein [Colocasia esculenta]